MEVPVPKKRRSAHALWASVRNKFVPHFVDDEMVSKVLERKDRDEQIAEGHYHMDNFNSIRFEDTKNVMPVLHEMFLLGCLPIIPFIITAAILPTKVRFDYQVAILGLVLIFEVLLLWWANRTLKILNSWDVFQDAAESLEGVQSARHVKAEMEAYQKHKRKHSLAGQLGDMFKVFGKDSHENSNANNSGKDNADEVADDGEAEAEQLPLRARMELQEATHERRKQRWFVFMVIFSSLAGCVFGEVLYRNYAFPYYQYMHLKWVNTDVSPMLQPGKMIQDAGVLRFSKDSYLDRAHSSCYRSQDAYCIAPIVQPNPGQSADPKKNGHILPSSPSGTYDYFAVGKNCCGCPGTGDFQCGDWAFGSGQGGLRVLEEQDRANYYLAVQQWNAQNKVSTKTPIFLNWVNRPFERIREMKASHYYYGIMVTVGYFCALIIFALIIHSTKK